MSNGCICCTLHNDLRKEIIALSEHRRFDYLLIESTCDSGFTQTALAHRLQLTPPMAGYRMTCFARFHLRLFLSAQVGGKGTARVKLAAAGAISRRWNLTFKFLRLTMIIRIQRWDRRKQGLGVGVAR